MNSNIPKEFQCKILRTYDYSLFYWSVRDKYDYCNVLTGGFFKAKSNAVASCNKFMREHNFKWEWIA